MTKPLVIPLPAKNLDFFNLPISIVERKRKPRNIPAVENAIANPYLSGPKYVLELKSGNSNVNPITSHNKYQTPGSAQFRKHSPSKSVLQTHFRHFYIF